MAILSLAASGQSATLMVGGAGSNYTSIQEAIDAASPGDTILVNSGTYNECIDVSKQLTLRGIGMPKVSAVGPGDIYSYAITLSANGSTLEGFAATNASNMAGDPRGGAGILVISDGNLVKGNRLYGNLGNGIQLLNASNNVIEGNNITDRFAITRESHDNVIRENKIHDSFDGLNLIDSNRNILIGNKFTDNRLSVALNYADDNVVAGNTFTNSSEIALVLDSTNNNTIAGNYFSGKQRLIQLCKSNNDEIFGNTIDGALFGEGALEKGCGW